MKTDKKGFRYFRRKKYITDFNKAESKNKVLEQVFLEFGSVLLSFLRENREIDNFELVKAAFIKELEKIEAIIIEE